MSGTLLNVGCGRRAMPGWVNIDCVRLPGVDVVADLEACREVPLPFPDDSVDEFLLSHSLEHIRNTLPLMQELWRIAKPGAKCVIRVPYGSSDDAWEDPTHVRAYFLQSWLYYSQPAYWRADYGYRGDWQPETIDLLVHPAHFSGLQYEAAMAKTLRERNVIMEMVATLGAEKPARAPQRELQTPAQVRFVMIQ